jgi:hypothetical protein
MRKIVHSQSNKLHAYAIAATRAILIALNMADEDRNGLLGFAFRWRVGNGEFQWLKGMKVFPSPDRSRTDCSSREAAVD